MNEVAAGPQIYQYLRASDVDPKTAQRASAMLRGRMPIGDLMELMEGRAGIMQLKDGRGLPWTEGELADKFPRLKEGQVYKRRGTNAVPVPSVIKSKLDEYIIGQDEAKKVISVAAYNHYTRVEANKKRASKEDMVLGKSNILLVGPTGCGKTLIAQTLARVLSVPIAISDATDYTPDGYVGADVSDSVRELEASCDGDTARANKGIVFIDEVDKLAYGGSASRRGKKGSYAHGAGPIKGLGSQQALLKLVEGKAMRKKQGAGGGLGSMFQPDEPEEDKEALNTENILFIIGGAFSGITAGSSYEGVVTPQDIIDYGMMPEFVGRFPMISTLKALDKAALIRILQEPKDALIKQFKKLFELQGVELYFEPGCVELIAEKAVEKGIGARGLRGLMEGHMLDLMFSLPDNEDLTRVMLPVEVFNGGHADPVINPDKVEEAWI